jgi:predicted house-cleaning noncanonical NTP pyrophosphatase (MazG superfamily)
MSELTPAPKGYPIKLVRDRTAEILNGSGQPGALWYEAGAEDRLRWLRLKLGEELAEYLVDGGLDELADVLAVVAALATEHGSNFAALIARMQADPRGGFFDGVMMLGRHPEFDGSGSVQVGTRQR